MIAVSTMPTMPAMGSVPVMLSMRFVISFTVLPTMPVMSVVPVVTVLAVARMLVMRRMLLPATTANVQQLSTMVMAMLMVQTIAPRMFVLLAHRGLLVKQIVRYVSCNPIPPWGIPREIVLGMHSERAQPLHLESPP